MFLHSTKYLYIKKQNTIMIDEDFLQMMCPYRIYKVNDRYLQHWYDSDEVLDITESEEIKRAVLCSSK